MGESSKVPWNLFLAAKYALLVGLIVALLVVVGLNLLEGLNFGTAGVGTFVLILSAIIVVSALRTALKALFCFALSYYAAVRRRAVPLRALLFNAYVWNDHDNARELGWLWLLAAAALSLLPMVFVTVASFGGTSNVVPGAKAEYIQQSAGIGRKKDDKSLMITSFELMPQEARRVVDGVPFRYICSGPMNDSGGSFLTYAHIPAWPYSNSSMMGDQGQVLVMEGADGFTLVSNCTPGTPALSKTLHAADNTPDSPNITVAQNLTNNNDSIWFVQRFWDAPYGALTCEARIRRATMRSSWVVNSSGYFVQSCETVVPKPYNRNFTNLEAIDGWLSLPVRNTFKHIVYPAMAEIDIPKHAVDLKVRASLVHLVAWTYAATRDPDPAHGAQYSGPCNYTCWPLQTYYSMHTLTFVLLLVAEVVLLASLLVRLVPHGFHGGSVTQLIHLCRNLPFGGWETDPIGVDAGRASTQIAVVLEADADSFCEVANVPRVQSSSSNRRGGQSSHRPPSMLGERDFVDEAFTGTGSMRSDRARVEMEETRW